MLTTIKVYVCNAVKIYKKQSEKIFKRGLRAPGVPVLGPHL